jgi:hypothetical protein
MVRDSAERRLQGSRTFSSYIVMVRDGALWDFLVMGRFQQLLVGVWRTLYLSNYAS